MSLEAPQREKLTSQQIQERKKRAEDARQQQLAAIGAAEKVYSYVCVCIYMYICVYMYTCNPQRR